MEGTTTEAIIITGMLITTMITLTTALCRWVSAGGPAITITAMATVGAVGFGGRPHTPAIPIGGTAIMPA